jgi:ketosteroid isomerase-like protein
MNNMTGRWFTVHITVLAAALTGCAVTRSHPDSIADLAAIATFNQRYLQAINDGDIAALSALTTEDHIMLAPNRPPLIGKDANDNANRRAFEQFDIDETWTPEETVVAGDWAWQRGTYQVVATPKSDGASHTSTGNFLRIYRRQPDGSWRMIRDMFNSDQPPASN